MMTINKAWEIVSSEKVVDILSYLYSRWQDERGYEDIKDYLGEIKKWIPEANRMTGDPFGFSVKCSDGSLRVLVEPRGEFLDIKGKMTRKAG